ncbi:4Fe-4S binding protein [Caldimonas aquatica]|uniref:4Fe-4S binding protein n=1 Tax=Caldimonas aquatica TaxID=376175 RepID=A0ABY6MVF3_9BURK|nr:4Fe-4S binding protein [Schlegelella aquatica]UZD55956.1 4Fe-4S binding protein [Schlegelella aquatica]
MKTLLCNCNRTMPLDGQALSRALGSDEATVHTTLCRREAPAFQHAARSGDDLLVACTQESRLFLELNDATEGAAPVTERPIRFVNIRETGGWSKDAAAATPKIAALLAAAQLPDPEPVPTVSYRSVGRCLVIGPAEAAEGAADLLADKLDVTLLVEGRGGGLPQRRERAVHAGRLLRLTGWLGAFEATWESGNPIDLDLCTRCNACIEACPEGAIDFSYQIDLEACRSHRDCVRVCEAAGAIDFQREAQTVTEAFDLVLDLGAQARFTMHQPPQGYFHVGGDSSKLLQAVVQLRELIGEFEKPKFFQYKQKLCAHSRNEKVGCDACIEVCSARAIESQAATTGGIRVEPHLCVGCGACTTVCPSGALGYAYPNTVDQGRRLRTLLSTYAKAGGAAQAPAALLIHSEKSGARVIEDLGRAARTDAAIRGVPARVLPVAAWHTASIGLDLWLAAIAYGASDVWVLLTQEEAPEYHEALAQQAAVANAILEGLGYGGERVRLLRARDARDLAALDAELHRPARAAVRQAAGFATQSDKRSTLELAIDHLVAHAASVPEAIALPAAGTPFGAVRVDTERCTLCLSCVGACPESALADNPERPQLRFIEKNCVQCGLCEATCPEQAITLQPRLWLADGGKARKLPRVLHEVEPYRCVRCGKPFGTLKAVEVMIGKLAGHAAFQGAALERLRMCGDCRVVDIYTNPNEVRITDL